MASHSASKSAHIRANERYNEKVYKQIAVRFKKDEDSDLLTAFDDAHKNGISKRKLIRAWYEASKK